MAIIGVKTGLIVTVEAAGTPRSGLIAHVDTGAGAAESHRQVPLANASTSHFGKATSGTATAARLIKMAVNDRQDVALS